jgi:hypothetical protein
MTNKEAMEIVLKMAKKYKPQSEWDLEAEALAQMEDYYNDVLED